MPMQANESSTALSPLPKPAGQPEQAGDQKPLLLEEVYLEKITIDGICGVY